MEVACDVPGTQAMLLLPPLAHQPLELENGALITVGYSCHVIGRLGVPCAHLLPTRTGFNFLKKNLTEGHCTSMSSEQPLGGRGFADAKLCGY